MTDDLRDRIAAALSTCQGATTWAAMADAVMAVVEAEQREYDETVVGDLNQRVTRFARQAGTAEAAVERVRHLHQRYRDVEAVGDSDSCAHCNQITGHRVPWPCPTIQALEAP